MICLILYVSYSTIKITLLTLLNITDPLPLFQLILEKNSFGEHNPLEDKDEHSSKNIMKISSMEVKNSNNIVLKTPKGLNFNDDLIFIMTSFFAVSGISISTGHQKIHIIAGKLTYLSLI